MWLQCIVNISLSVSTSRLLWHVWNVSDVCAILTGHRSTLAGHVIEGWYSGTAAGQKT